MPKIPSMRIIDLVGAISNYGIYKVVDIRPGEKIHETLIHEEEGRNTVDMDDYFLISPQFEFETKNHAHYKDAQRVQRGFICRSDLNKKWLTTTELKEMLKNIELEQ